MSCLYNMVMGKQAELRLQKIYKQSQLKPPYNKMTLARRYWVYQWERLPLLPLILMGLVSNAAVMKAADVFSWTRLLAGTVLVTAYLLQIRFADEPKDFEHDNKFYPSRPVQRGVITLRELTMLRNIMIGIFFATAIILQSWPIFLLACLQQFYSYLTRKEFFIRDWLRMHFLTYMFSHYLQLLILGWLIITVLQLPEGQKILYFGFALLSMAVVEVSRKMQEADNNAAGDTYSAVLGALKATGFFIGFVIGYALYTALILNRVNGNTNFLLITFAGTTFAFYSALMYARVPDKRNTKALQGSGLICHYLFSITILVGA